MILFRGIFSSLVVILALSAAPPGLFAQESDGSVPAAGSPDRSATGGAQTLEDILARQRGMKVDDAFRRSATGDPEHAAPMSGPLGTLGGASDPELWRAMRFGTAELSSSARTPGATLLVQDSGVSWLHFREGPLRTYGGYAVLATLGLLALFYLLFGRVRIDAGFSGITIERFKPVERFGHWLLAGSFVLLALTGLFSVFGRAGLIPWMGRDAYATVALASKWIHNNVGWAFIVGLILVFVMWVAHNFPNRHDLVWLAKAGGLFSRHSHPPSRKFNAGQKIVFWAVIVLGASAAASGLSMLFPFQLPLFAKTFSVLNDIGAPGWIGMDPLPTEMTPQQEMQLAQLWHSIVGFAMMALILLHIYIGTLGMEGAFSAMGEGEVDLNWAKEHHSVWAEETQAGQDRSPDSTAPAE